VNDYGLYERQCEQFKVDPVWAEQAAESAKESLDKLRNEMYQRGLLQREDQNFAGETKRARVVAPIHSDEIRLGALLGVGGFSAVSEVSSFVLNGSFCQRPNFDHYEELSRQFLARQAMRFQNYPSAFDKLDDETASTKSTLSRRRGSHPAPPTPRYALKHLRFNLAKEPEKYHRACIDLVLEGQLLLGMDHPNIMNLRGWPMFGTDAIRSGRLTDYFLILDRLPETLEQRLWTWRTKLRKYRTRCSFPFFQSKKYVPKINKLFNIRLDAAHSIASAIAYMHSKRIINRDIKSANIGFDVRGDLKLFDFGLSRFLPNTSDIRTDDEQEQAEYCMSRVGTKFYIAPEIRKKKPYSLPADVYSFGVVFWELVALSSPRDFYEDVRRNRKHEKANLADDPFHRPDPNHEGLEKDIPRRRSSVDVPLPTCPCWPETVQQMVGSCLSEKPDDRPMMSEIEENLMTLRLESSNSTGSGGVCGEDDSQERVRRRSTFRIDLSALQATSAIANHNRTYIADASSCVSKTSISTCDYYGTSSCR